MHTVKGQLAGVRHSLKEWVLGSIVETCKAARDPTGPFELLRDLPEFRDLVVELAPPAASADTTASELHTAQMQVTAPEIVAAPPPPTEGCAATSQGTGNDQAEPDCAEPIRQCRSRRHFQVVSRQSAGHVRRDDRLLSSADDQTLFPMRGMHK